MWVNGEMRVWIKLVHGVVTRRIILTNNLLLWSVNADKMSSQNVFGSSDQKNLYRWSLWVILGCNSVFPSLQPCLVNRIVREVTVSSDFAFLIHAHRRCSGIIFWPLRVWNVINGFEKLETLKFIVRDIQNYFSDQDASHTELQLFTTVVNVVTKNKSR